MPKIKFLHCVANEIFLERRFLWISYRQLKGNNPSNTLKGSNPSYTCVSLTLVFGVQVSVCWPCAGAGLDPPVPTGRLLHPAFLQVPAQSVSIDI